MSTLDGLMQDDYGLTVGHVRARLSTNTGSVISPERNDPDGVIEPVPYRTVARRVHRIAHALRSLGVVEGERVGTFTWNTVEHLELFIAIPSYGAVLHTVNVRLFEEQLAYVIDHAGDRVIFVSPDLVGTLAPLVGRLPKLEHVVICGDADGVDTSALPGVTSFEDLMAEAPDDDFEFPRLRESQAAALCYTSGTTGNPKGVLYSQRSIALHGSGLLAADSFGLRRSDRVLVVVPMFHVNAWGLPFAAILADADLILPGRDLRPATIAGLIETQRATVMGGVPTVYSDLLGHLDAAGADLSTLRECFSGGSAISETLMRAYSERHGVEIYQAWGMTETSPVCTVSRPPGGVVGEDVWPYRVTQGRAVPWVELRLIDAEGELAQHDGEARGELEVRGPWVASAYFDDDSGEERFNDGWLRTGDVATISADGYLRIVDRAKDVIKSGGEWISSVALENELLSHPAVESVAVIPVPDARWDERPLACVVVKAGGSVTSAELREHLSSRVARWWVPEQFVFVLEIPRTGVGKFNKRALREAYADGELNVPEPVAR